MSPVRRSLPLLLLGALAALGAKRLVHRLVLLKLRHDLRALNAGDYKPLLSGFAQDAVLRFNEGDHRWAGDHRGKAAIERFFEDFVAAGVKGEIVELFISGAPWRMNVMVRFDDHVTTAAGEELYSNRTFLLARTRWGRIVWQEDFYEDTGRIGVLDARLSELGVAPVAVAA
jgi:ketosteroid isomerase-like protein